MIFFQKHLTNAKFCAICKNIVEVHRKMQKLRCPMCGSLLIKNCDLVTDKKVEFGLDEIKAAKPEEVGKIKCYNCKRQIKYLLKD